MSVYLKYTVIEGDTLSAKHEFGIMDYVEKNKSYIDYEPERYNCVSVDDDIFNEIYNKNYEDKIKKIETFAHNTNRPYEGFAYCGITLIPPKSLKQFLDIIIVENVNYRSKQLEILIEKISDAIKNSKYLIHFGI